MKYTIGVDLGGTTVKMGIFTVDAKPVEKWMIPTRKENHGNMILDDIAASLNQKLAKRGISKDEVTGIGMGVPGAVKDGKVLVCVNIGWENVDAKAILSKSTGIKVNVTNDANLAALGEMWQGAGKNCKNGVMVTLGTGVGGGIIVDGKILEGNSGFGGEIGHITMNPAETIACNCGKKGCLEQYASATGIVRMAKEMMQSEADTPSALRSIGRLSAKDVLDAAKTGDPLAVEIADRVFSILGLGLSYVACVTDPEVFMIGGGVSKAGTIVTDLIQKHYVSHVHGELKNAKFMIATLDNDAGIIGGAKLGMN